MTIALPITQPGAELSNDGRHYTAWEQVRSPTVVNATAANPLPEDPGTVDTVDRHFTEWQTKPR